MVNGLAFLDRRRARRRAKNDEPRRDAPGAVHRPEDPESPRALALAVGPPGPGGEGHRCRVRAERGVRHRRRRDRGPQGPFAPRAACASGTIALASHRKAWDNQLCAVRCRRENRTARSRRRACWTSKTTGASRPSPSPARTRTRTSSWGWRWTPGLRRPHAAPGGQVASETRRRGRSCWWRPPTRAHDACGSGTSMRMRALYEAASVRPPRAEIPASPAPRRLTPRRRRQGATPKGGSREARRRTKEATRHRAHRVDAKPPASGLSGRLSEGQRRVRQGAEGAGRGAGGEREASATLRREFRRRGAWERARIQLWVPRR